MRGGEQVLESILNIFPEADLFTHVVAKENLSSKLASRDIKTTFINRLPGSQKHYQKYLPLMPFALELLDFDNYDIVISIESGPAKGVITPPGTYNVCVCLTPMRYIWDQKTKYLEVMGKFQGWLLSLASHYLRIWDVTSSRRVNDYIAISRFIGSRIMQFYGRQSEVINPPVRLGTFEPPAEGGTTINWTEFDYYLYVGQLVNYKGVIEAVEGFSQSEHKLVVVGAGELEKVIREKAGSNIDLKGRLPSRDLVKLMKCCRALVFPGVEDYGIVPLEAQACGKPVVALGEGGVLDTVKGFWAEEGPEKADHTGVFYTGSGPGGLMEGVAALEHYADAVKSESCVNNAANYSVPAYEELMERAILDGWHRYNASKLNGWELNSENPSIRRLGS
jgi:glycosyltransferase involved in cell wall biosynthesis